MSGASTIPCPDCGTAIAPGLLACPACRRLVHAAELKALAAEASRAEAEDPSAALAAWRRARELLPPESAQHAEVTRRMEALGRRVDERPAGAGPASAPPARPAWAGKAGVFGAIGLFLWKLKFFLALAVTKGKFLLLGLTKAGTFFSMMLSMGAYWAAWGWKFAAGLVLSIYIHEMGHVAALSRYGIRATAPMFIPGFGALIRLKQYPASAREDARIGLAGPLWGLGAAAAAAAVALATGWESWGAVARAGAWINLFNLLPVWQLDGSRGFRALSRRQRWIAAAAIGAAWYGTGEGLLFLILLAAGARALGGRSPEEPDRTALIQYVLLVAALSVLCLLPVAAPPI